MALSYSSWRIFRFETGGKQHKISEHGKMRFLRIITFFLATNGTFHFHSRGKIRFEGTWEIKDGDMISRIRTSNSVPVVMVDVAEFGCVNQTEFFFGRRLRKEYWFYRRELDTDGKLAIP